MSQTILLNHTLPELTELGLLSFQVSQALHHAGVRNTNDFLEVYKKHGDFTYIPDLTEQAQENLLRLAKAYLNVERGQITKEDLFDPAIFKDHTPFVPVVIEWEKVAGIKRAFLDAWVMQSIRDFFDPLAELFVKDRLGGVSNAEEFYNRVILHPVDLTVPSVRDSVYAPALRRLIRIFLNYYHATRLFDDPFELLCLYARIEFGVDPGDEAHARIHKFHPDGCLQFAHAVYRLIMASTYFNHRRGYQDINRMRFVSLLDSDPYTHGQLEYLFRMSEGRFNEARKEAEDFAEIGCRAVIEILKALGFTESYRTLKSWDDQFISKDLVQEMNRREGLDLPAPFYALLFNALYGTHFVRSPRLRVDGVGERLEYVNANFGAQRS
ncbi:MAG: hypothetical protein ABI432_10405 [Flavobacteriales bacterium]